jgi:hypothetical protein
MATSTYTVQGLAIQYKNALKSFNSQIDISSVGTYWDVTAYASSAVGKEILDWNQQVSDGNVPENASGIMLEYWANGLGIVPRKTGKFATGFAKIDTKDVTLPVTIPAGTIFSVVTLEYTSTEDTVIDTNNVNVPVVASGIGAEFNINAGVNLSNSLGLEAESETITGGTGDETDALLLQRILLNISRRKTDGMLTDYLQRALELYSYAEAETIFVENVVPYGVGISVANIVNDFDVAASNPLINEINIPSVDLASSSLQNYSTVTAVMQLSSPFTQVINNIVVYITTSTGENLTSSQEIEVRKATRKALLEFSGDVLTSFSLSPEYPDYVESYSFNSFAPINRNSPLMDSINIGVVNNNG